MACLFVCDFCELVIDGYAGTVCPRCKAFKKKMEKIKKEEGDDSYLYFLQKEAERRQEEIDMLGELPEDFVDEKEDEDGTDY